MEGASSVDQYIHESIWTKVWDYIHNNVSYIVADHTLRASTIITLNLHQHVRQEMYPDED